MERKLYFAYGSNMDVEQMRFRCPAAKPVKPYALAGYRLVFRRVADIIPDPDRSVHGVLWSITPDCELALDRYEGFRARTPKAGLYRKETFKLKLPSSVREVMFYTMNESGFGEPGESYGTCIRKAYEYWDLPVGDFWEAIHHARSGSGSVRR
jgi:gamma-glutamylcyclotransferase (GGCT)/AIG2-like uncharacterized protein YtfP